MNLRDAIGKDVYIIDGETFTDTGLRAIPAEELERLKMRIGLKINSLSLAIREKQIEHSEGGAGSTKEWYVKRKYALAINQRMLPFVNILIKQRRRSERSIGDLFMDQARLILPQNDFENILENARLIKTEGK
jgi:hypothetical protein